jgi:hypothetical protein
VTALAAWWHLVLQDPIRWEVAKALAVCLFTGLLLGNLGGNVELAARWVYFGQLEVFEIEVGWE